MFGAKHKWSLKEIRSFFGPIDASKSSSIYGGHKLLPSILSILGSTLSRNPVSKDDVACAQHRAARVPDST